VSSDLAAASISLHDLQTARNQRRRELHKETDLAPAAG